MDHEATAEIGIIGLAVMGRNLALNLSDHGVRVAVYNRTTERMLEFLAGPAANTAIRGYRELPELVAALERPRRVLLMVRAGRAVDAVLDELTPLLEPGDIVIDGGNSHYRDTIRRNRELATRGLRFVGMGVSGGEEGARYGPSLMPGGDAEAWPHLETMLQRVAAKVDGVPCCDWVGPDGSGHYVKMVHNGIEYGDMQLIAEVYQLMKFGLGLDAEAMAEIFARWNERRLESYLIEITADILRVKDDDGAPLVEKVLDSAGQKGTGKWAVIDALELGVPLTLIGEAVFARFLSALKEERMAASRVLAGPTDTPALEREAFVSDLEAALYAAKVTSYAQGFMLLRSSAEQHDWPLDLGSIAQLWRGGCIIRSAFLGEITAAYREVPDLENLLLAPFFREQVQTAQSAWRRVVAQAAMLGVPTPALSAALAFYDGYRAPVLGANLIQAQRDYFGAHTYERVDGPRGKRFHTDWQSAAHSANGAAETRVEEEV